MKCPKCEYTMINAGPYTFICSRCYEIYIATSSTEGSTIFEETSELDWDKLRETLFERDEARVSKKDIPPAQWRKMWEGNFEGPKTGREWAE